MAAGSVDSNKWSLLTNTATLVLTSPCLMLGGQICVTWFSSSSPKSGRVMSDKGGDTILRICNEILADEYPELAAKCNVTLPDEKMHRVGQSVAAASLPVTKN